MSKLSNRRVKTTKKRRKCPKCGNKYVNRPALSRQDTTIKICPECGLQEALEAFASVKC